MKIRWLGNAAVEVFSDKHIFIDPNFTVEPTRKADIVLLTHEHDDHFDKSDYEKWTKDKVDLFGPKTALRKFVVKGRSVKVGDKIGSIEVLDCKCWSSEESVSYFHRGLLHSGDSNIFPEIREVKLIFTACFPDYYDDYLSAFRRLKPELVVPFHYDPEDEKKDALGLVKLLNENDIQSKIIKPGDHIEI